ncbi:CDP-alcohol phosphatidyltransferase family protein [Candidatus Woesearchaeota archaeon]|nr:CDP-alcohol phosphatidyltransferase family protein [Candidatus Woesearchaeota archaeon]
MERVNNSIVARAEQAVLARLARFVPGFICPDHLTALAFAAALGIGASYWFAYKYRVLFLVAAALYAVHWYSDSLDGKIARERKMQRPRYGHYVDHLLDSVTVAVVLIGLTVSAETLTAAWMWVTSGFLLLMIHAYLKASVTGTFELSIGFLGATEARIIAAAFSILLFFTGNPVLSQWPVPLTLLDITGSAAAIIIWMMLTVQVVTTARKLDREDRKKWEKSR